ncbi:GNAT family N-acetyltransferase [Tolypothrix sp. VBCCA 56010]|uniref:GNAT family N-acetyltransferase n=1 Tax=Tolypothrix sp. VBCCA 56010 TaxID=3137731 RepID=UPI003D7C99AA
MSLIEKTIIGTVQFVFLHDDLDLADGVSTAYLQALEVDRHYRRQGIATFLIQEVESEAMKQGFERLTVMVEPDNQTAINLYYKMGFSFFKRSKDTWEEKEYPVLCLKKTLAKIGKCNFQEQT